MTIDVGRIIKYEELVKKVRLLSIIDNKILICIYNGHYMLPGGKIDENETPEMALKREIKEETNHDIKEFTHYLTVNNYAENHLSRNSNIPKNRKIISEYFITNEKILLNNDNNLSDKEKEGNFIIKYIDINTLINDITNNTFTQKQKIYADEVLKVLRYYLRQDKLIDLHTHTTNSDGEYTPEEVINKAIEAGIKTIAITDHDTISGLNNINYNNPAIEIIPGTELSVKIEKGRMHILGLGIDYKNPALLNYLKEMKYFNRFNLQNIIDYLKTIGIEFKPTDIAAIMSKSTNVGRPDIANLLIIDGYVESVQEAFDKYLIEAFDHSKHLNKGHSYKEVLKVIKEANGISILAHPVSLNLENKEFEKLIEEMVANDLQGIEVFHPHISQEMREYYTEIAKKYNLLISGGTDFHGEHVKPDIKLGTGRDNIYITDLPIIKKLK